MYIYKIDIYLNVVIVVSTIPHYVGMNNLSPSLSFPRYFILTNPMSYAANT